MGYDKKQFREVIDEFTAELGLQSDAATELLLGTAAIESNFGTFFEQVGAVAFGAFQMEESTFQDLVNRFGAKFPQIHAFTFSQLRYDLRAATMMARIKYYSIPEALPHAGDLVAQASYYKIHYNTPLGAATLAEYIAAWKRYCV